MAIQVEYSWIPSNEVEEVDDRAGTAEKVAVPHDYREACEPREKCQGWSLGKEWMLVTEVKWIETDNWWKAKHNHKKMVYRMNRIRMIHVLLGEAKKKIAGR